MLTWLTACCSDSERKPQCSSFVLRFAAAVAKRLALLGVLTQGDRRATGQSSALGLGTFDMDNKFGKAALKEMVKRLLEHQPSGRLERFRQAFF